MSSKRTIHPPTISEEDLQLGNSNWMSRSININRPSRLGVIKSTDQLISLTGFSLWFIRAMLLFCRTASSLNLTSPQVVVNFLRIWIMTTTRRDHLSSLSTNIVAPTCYIYIKEAVRSGREEKCFKYFAKERKVSRPFLSMAYLVALLFPFVIVIKWAKHD